LGLYSDEAAQDTTGQKYLRGYQVTDSNGKVHFLTIYPGWYHGRTPHIHCRVRVYSGSVTTYNYTTQFFFDQTITNSVYATAPYNTRGTQDTYNTTDLFYTADDCMTGNEVGTESMLSLAEGAKYAVASIKVKVDLSLPTNSTC
jgi:protocatechuate 3,4-dioxygenase beta subunit